MATEIEDDIIEPRQNGVLGKVFGSCAGDPRGSVHRAWGVSLLFILLYFILAILESELFDYISFFCVLETHFTSSLGIT